MKTKIMGAMLLLLALAGCKQDEVISDCVAVIDNVYTAFRCHGSGQLTNDSLYLNTFRPSQSSLDNLYAVELRCSPRLGEVVLDTAANGEFAGPYFIFYRGAWYQPDVRLYSLYGVGTNGKLAITSIDTANKYVEIKFSGILCRRDSTDDRVRIMIEKFKAYYR